MKYLDDRPVFDDDRRNAEAFARGGLDEERKERALIAQEKKDRDEANRVAFKDMIRKAREEKRLADEQKAAAERSASPAEAEESKKEAVVNNEEDQEDDDEEDEAPPELE